MPPLTFLTASAIELRYPVCNVLVPKLNFLDNFCPILHFLDHKDPSCCQQTRTAHHKKEYSQKQNLGYYIHFEIFDLLGHYAAFSAGSVPTFRDNLSVPSSRAKKSKKGVLLGLLNP
jgi:hypothetical protein